MADPVVGASSPNFDMSQLFGLMAPGAIGPNGQIDLQALQRQRAQNTMMAMGAALLQAGRPSAVPIGFGEGLGYALEAGQKANAGADKDALTIAQLVKYMQDAAYMADKRKRMGDLATMVQGGMPGLDPAAGGASGPPKPGSVRAELPGGSASKGAPPDNAAPAELVSHYESGNRPYIGTGNVDLTNAPLDRYGFPQWAGIPTPQGRSHAAGLYQFQPGTWAKYAGPLGITDFSPESQRKVFEAAYAAEGWGPWAPYNSNLRAALQRRSGGAGGSTTQTADASPDDSLPQIPNTSLAGAGGGTGSQARQILQSAGIPPTQAEMRPGGTPGASSMPAVGAPLYGRNGEITGYRAAGPLPDLPRPDYPPNTKFNSRGEPISPTLATMTPAERARAAEAYRQLRAGTFWGPGAAADSGEEPPLSAGASVLEPPAPGSEGGGGNFGGGTDAAPAPGLRAGGVLQPSLAPQASTDLPQPAKLTVPPGIITAPPAPKPDNAPDNAPAPIAPVGMPNTIQAWASRIQWAKGIVAGYDSIDEKAPAWIEKIAGMDVEAAMEQHKKDLELQYAAPITTQRMGAEEPYKIAQDLRTTQREMYGRGQVPINPNDPSQGVRGLPGATDVAAATAAATEEGKTNAELKALNLTPGSPEAIAFLRNRTPDNREPAVKLIEAVQAARARGDTAGAALLEGAITGNAPPADLKEYDRYKADESASGRTPMSYFAWDQARRRAGATMINTAEGMDAAQTRARLELDRAVAKEVIDMANQGRRSLPLIDQVIALANKTPEGWAGPVSAELARAFSALGYPVSERMSNAELLQTISLQQIGSVRQPGAQSNKEMDAYKQAVPGLSQSAAGRIKIAEMNKAVIQRQIEMAAIYRKYIGKDELDERLAELDRKPLFNDSQHAAMATSPTAGTAPGTPAVGSVQQGYQFLGGDPGTPQSWRKVQ